MSDLGRKDMSSSVKDKMTPDSSKSTTDKVGQGISGTMDKVARDIVPDSQKSTSQSLGDKASRTKDNNDGKTTVEKVKDAVGMGNK